MNLEEFNRIRKTVGTSAGTLGYAEIGDGPPALFIHGLFVSSYAWRGRRRQLFWPAERPDELVGPLRRHWAAARAGTSPATA